MTSVGRVGGGVAAARCAGVGGCRASAGGPKTAESAAVSQARQKLITSACRSNEPEVLQLDRLALAAGVVDRVERRAAHRVDRSRRSPPRRRLAGELRALRQARRAAQAVGGAAAPRRGRSRAGSARAPALKPPHCVERQACAVGAAPRRTAEQQTGGAISRDARGVARASIRFASLRRHRSVRALREGRAAQARSRSRTRTARACKLDSNGRQSRIVCEASLMRSDASPCHAAGRAGSSRSAATAARCRRRADRWVA